MTLRIVTLSFLVLTLALTFASWGDAGGQAKHGFLHRVHKDPDGKEAKFIVFVPHSYTGDKAFPLILFLHGKGESGSDGKKQATAGLGNHIRKVEKTFPFITVFPQSQHESWAAKSEDGQRALAILEQVKKKFNVDPQRIYLSGLSMGGFGVWNMAAAHPDMWAAIVPICGGGNPNTADKIKDIPCWCFHGGADSVVPVKRSREMIDALKKAGGNPIYTEYPGVDHNSWDRAYSTEKLYTWLLQHKLN
jgi:predicted peptidase